MRKLHINKVFDDKSTPTKLSFNYGIAPFKGPTLNDEGPDLKVWGEANSHHQVPPSHASILLKDERNTGPLHGAASSHD